MTNTSKTRLSICVSLLLALFAFPTQALTYDEYDTYLDDWAFDVYGWSIDQFDAQIEVREDASFLVTETIDVTYGVYKHGIYREVPVTYRDQLGNRLTIDIDIQAVYQDGHPAMVDIYNSGHDRVVKIGDPDVTITGAHEYMIVYEVERALLYDDEATTLYWNVTGTDWEVPIYNSSAAVIFPNGVEPTAWACYVGAYGSTDQDCGSAQDDEIIAFAADNYLTISVDIPAGSVWEPTLADRAWWFFSDNWLGVLPLVILFGMVLWWLKHGRDPNDQGTVIAQYDPPDGLWAVYVGMLLSNRAKQRFITAMIIQLAAKGYLDMTVAGNTKKKHPGNITIKKLKDGKDLDEAHKLLFDRLFKSGDSVKLNKLKGKILPSDMTKIKSAAMQKMVDDGYFLKGSFKRQIGGLIIGLLVLFSSFIAWSFFGTFVGLLFLVCGLICSILGYLMPKVTEQGARARWYAKGFDLFLKTADQYRSRFQERENIFSDFLPYAIALDHVDEWAKAFVGMDQAPSWYHSSQPFLYTAFISEMGSVTKAVTLATAPTAPSGGASGGGGFSGGGFGGGGGGSW